MGVAIFCQKSINNGSGRPGTLWVPSTFGDLKVSAR